ncbi:MAG: xanthine dehydrogenase family protein subunit M [Rhodobacterales bacterium]|nr:xanthine dehydrogenase family protein subunit M [Rhodobacterales bacterium]
MQYHTPDSFEDAVAIANAATGTTRFLAGGTDVLVQLRADIVTPDDLIDIKHIAGTHDITHNADGSWTIGVAVTGAEMSEHPTLKNDWPGLVEAMDLVGSTQIQGRATLVGNLCNGSPAADSVPAMIAINASIDITNATDTGTATRQVAAADIHTGPGKTSLTKGDVISAVNIPAVQPNSGDAYLRFIPRTEMDIAVVGVAVNLTLEGDTITAAKVVLGAVAPSYVTVTDAANALIGSTLDEAALDALATAASAACNPIDDKRGTIEFRTQVSGVLAKRAAVIAYARAKGANT